MFLRDLRKEFMTRALRNSKDHMTKSSDDCFSIQKIQVVKAAWGFEIQLKAIFVIFAL